MSTRNVVPGDQQHELVETPVQSGRCEKASEVLREGVRLTEERERIEATKLKALQQAATQGWEDVAAGRYTDIANDQLDDFIGLSGQRAARQVQTTG